MIALLVALAGAHAARLVATVDPDLQTVHGVLDAPGDWTDPLARLPQPQDDRTLQRTFPGAPDVGSVTWDEHGAFTSVLPRRYGALGSQRGRGLWANGGWYPQDVSWGAQEWEVELTLPEGVVGVVNGVAGEGVLRWSGTAERVSIAVLDGSIERRGDLTILATGPTRPRRDAELERAHLGTDSGPLVVVEAPMHRRLVRPGEGVLYVSDLAFRTPRWLHRFHRGPVGAGMLQASSALDDVWARELVAAVKGAVWRDEAQELELGRLMRLGAFVPIVDQVLYSGTLPFHAEIFDETFLGDPLLDDLGEIYAPRVSGRVLATKLDDAFGPGTASAVVRELGDLPLGDACLAVGVDPAFLESWRVPYPDQDIQLEVQRDQGVWTLGLERLADAGAPPEVLRYRVDGQLRAWEMPEGPSRTEVPLDGVPRRVVLDPDEHVRQTDRAFDRWPARITAVGTVYPDTINVSQRILVGVATAQLRRQYDTRSALTLAASTNESDLAAGLVAYHRFFGPLKDRRTRTARVTLWSAGGWFSPTFATTAAGRYSLSSGLTWRRDTRIERSFPLRGTALGASVELGGVPESGRTWTGASATALGLASPHPRVVGAGRVSAGVATGFVEHRLLSLGGSSGLRSLPPGAILGHQRALGAVELRALPVRNASVPLLWLYWLDEVQLTAGLEAGGTRQASRLADGELIDPTLGGQAWAVGATAGVLLTTDGLGVLPWTVGLTVGTPLAYSGVATDGPQVYLRLGQEF